MTTFKGMKTGFNKTGNNDCDPNPMGPPTTKFTGRGGVPEGPLKHFPGPAADISMSNRRTAKGRHAEGDGSSTRYSTTTAFGTTRAGKRSGGSPKGDGTGRKAMGMNKK